MPDFFFDTSAIAKLYHAETGTAKVDARLVHGGAFLVEGIEVILTSNGDAQEKSCIRARRSRGSPMEATDETLPCSRFPGPAANSTRASPFPDRSRGRRGRRPAGLPGDPGRRAAAGRLCPRSFSDLPG